MNVEVKEWESLDKKGHPRAQIFQRLVHGGDILTIPDTPVVHEVDSDVEFETEIDEKTKKEVVKKDPVSKKPIPKKEKVITHPNVQVSPNPNADRVDMSEYEHRMHTLKTSPLCKRWSKRDKELFLKFYWYTPDWMREANRNSVPTINPEDSMPTRWGRDIPNVAPGGTTSVGGADTGEYVGKVAGMNEKDLIQLVNKTTDANRLNTMLEEERRSPVVREKVINVIEAQLKTASGG